MSERPLVGPHGQLDGMACLGSHESCSIALVNDQVFHSIGKW